jgi:hypothetical protein
MKTKASRRFLLLLIVLLAVDWQMMAGHVSADEWSLSSLMGELGGRANGKAQFVEEKHLSVLDTPIELSGTLAFAPGWLEKHTLQPRPERMIVDGGTLIIETGPDRKSRRLRLQDYPAIWGLVEGMRATLTGDLETLRRFYDIELHGTREDWELLMVPSRGDVSAVVRLVSIRGGNGQIRIIEVVQANGDRSVMRVEEAAS